MVECMKTFAVIVPTFNAGPEWIRWLDAYASQSIKPQLFLVIDSQSKDDTAELALKYGAHVKVISPRDFNHGGTRNYAASLVGDVDIIVFLTQDAILEGVDSLSTIIECFDVDDIAAVCGKQIPHYDANPLACHAREFNYQSSSCIKSQDDVDRLGLKTAFMSNSFSAYRHDAFEKLGKFPKNTILAEDMYLAAKMILSGCKIAYCAKAVVRHSHNYTPWEEFRRYFDTGVFHASEPWIQEALGGASGEGCHFVKSELRYLWQHAPLWIPRALLTTVCKLAGYKLGRNYQKLPKSLCPKLSMYKSYWLQQDK